MNDYLDNPETAPNFNAIPEEEKQAILDTITSADGNIYSLAKYEPQSWNLTPYRMYINQAWLDNLGLDMPETTDELHEVLKAFVNNDPNGTVLRMK